MGGNIYTVNEKQAESAARANCRKIFGHDPGRNSKGAPSRRCSENEKNRDCDVLRCIGASPTGCQRDDHQPQYENRERNGDCYVVGKLFGMHFGNHTAGPAKAAHQHKYQSLIECLRIVRENGRKFGLSEKLRRAAARILKTQTCAQAMPCNSAQRSLPRISTGHSSVSGCRQMLAASSGTRRLHCRLITNTNIRRGIDSLAPTRFGLSARPSMSLGSRRLRSRYDATFSNRKPITNKGIHRDIHAEERTGRVRFRSRDIRRFCLRNCGSRFFRCRDRECNRD
jgi:hypothetical protein